MQHSKYPNDQKMAYERKGIVIVSILVWITGLISLLAQSTEGQMPTRPEHVKVFYEKGNFGGWPANWGIWNWGNEILVGYTKARHQDRDGHDYDVETAVTQFSRSLDGGKTWKAENAYDHGITEATWEHHIPEKSSEPIGLPEEIDFSRPNFALTFRMRHALDGGTSFFYSYDRGKNWDGPFDLQVDFPGQTPVGIVSRTDYIVEGPHEMTAFLTVGFRNEDRHWRQVACVRTTDGGKSWKHLAWIGPQGINSIMPSSVRLGKKTLLTVIRQTNPPKMESYISRDNGSTWNFLNSPAQVDDNGHPAALLKLDDGRLSIVYGIRHETTMKDGVGMYVVFSHNNGKSWSDPLLIRGHDGASSDMGYPRSVQIPNGNIVAVYYYNHEYRDDRFRYIAATIFKP